jgi:hypothetical protein
LTTLEFDTAYHSFDGEVEASTTPTICRLLDLHRHQLSTIAPRDQVAGFWLWEVKDMKEAVAWMKRCPNPMPGPSQIDIRPLYEPSDWS